MATLGDVKATKNLSQITRLDGAAIRLLWHVDFWDGPICGLLSYGGEDLWFEMMEENEDATASWYRRYLIVRLSAEQLADERRWHELFRQHVGTHNDYDDKGARVTGATKPRSQWDEFYGPYSKRVVPDLASNTVVGWWES